MTRRQLFGIFAATASLAPAVEVHDFMLDRLNRFNDSMRGFVDMLRQHRFDLKTARLLSKQWREVEESGEWPRL